MEQINESDHKEISQACHAALVFLVRRSGGSLILSMDDFDFEGTIYISIDDGKFNMHVIEKGKEH